MRMPTLLTLAEVVTWILHYHPLGSRKLSCCFPWEQVKEAALHSVSAVGRLLCTQNLLQALESVPHPDAVSDCCMVWRLSGTLVSLQVCSGGCGHGQNWWH